MNNENVDAAVQNQDDASLSSQGLEKVTKLLEEKAISFDLVKLPRAMNLMEAANHQGEQQKNILRLVTAKAGDKDIAAVLPFPCLFDIKIFSGFIHSEFKLIPHQSVYKSSKSLQNNSFPIVDNLMSCHIVVDESVLQLPFTLMESGDPNYLLRFDQVNLAKLFHSVATASFAVGPERINAGRYIDTQDEHQVDVSFTPMRLKQRIDETFDLPAMPDIAQDIMKLRVDPSADAAKLSKIVMRDPSLATQVISWASSPYYGYQGKIDSVETAIARVLGFELVMNLALGITIGKSLKVPVDGPLGVRAFWKQAIYSACFAEKLARVMPLKQRPERGLIYLSGLLHNFGHLLLGHIFPPQFFLINSTVEANPQIAVEDIEFYILGVTHEEIGAWLMQNWHMPEELIVAVHRHHQEEFWSKHAVYSNIVLIANRMLKRLQIGDSIHTEIPVSTLELLSLEQADVDAVFESIKNDAESLDIIAKQLVA